MANIHTMTIRKPDDFHVHLREGELLEEVLPATAEQFGRALVMPNLTEPVVTGKQANAYHERIKALRPDFNPLMTIYLTERTTPETIRDAAAAGVIAAKYYPKHGTTRADHGLMPDQLLRRKHVLKALEEHHMVLCLHGEDPSVPLLRREAAFLPKLVKITKLFPRLKIVLEHISTAKAVNVVEQLQNVAATVTAHHLVLTMDHVLGNHDCLCMPVAKTEQDRLALIKAITSGNPKFFFGSDSAPHPRGSKNKAKGAYGIYTAPVALPILAEIFRLSHRMKLFERFVSGWGAEWYELPLNEGEIELVHAKKPKPPRGEREKMKRQSAATVLPYQDVYELPWHVKTG